MSVQLNKKLKSVILDEAVSAGDLVEIINNHASLKDISIKEEKVMSLLNSFVFNSGSTVFTSITILDNSRILISYQDTGNSNYGTAIILSISDTTITSGSEFVFHSGLIYTTYVSTLDSSRVIVTYRTGTSPYYGTAIVLSINNLTITAGTPFNFYGGSLNTTHTQVLDGTRVLLVYSTNPGNSLNARVLSINNLTITAGTELALFSFGNNISVIKLNPSKCLATYLDTGNSNYGTAIILSINNLTITAGSEFVYNTATSAYNDVAKLDDTRVVVAYRDQGNSDKGTVVVLSVNGTTITGGSEFVFSSSYITGCYIDTIDSTKVVVAYMDETNSCGSVVILSINGTIVTANSNILVFKNNDIFSPYVRFFDSSKILIAYQDVSNSAYGTLSMLLINPVNNTSLFGYTTVDGTTNETIPVSIL